jgi:putative endonuclease
MNEHNSNSDPNSYVYGRAPVELKWSRHFDSEMEAIYAEKQIKGWSRAKKQALISGDIELLRALSESK